MKEYLNEVRQGFFYLFILVGLLGWVGAIARALSAPNEVTIYLPVTKGSYLHAHDLCTKYVGKAAENRVTVVVQDAAEFSYTVPCRLVMESLTQ